MQNKLIYIPTEFDQLVGSERSVSLATVQSLSEAHNLPQNRINLEGKIRNRVCVWLKNVIKCYLIYRLLYHEQHINLKIEKNYI